MKKLIFVLSLVFILPVSITNAQELFEQGKHYAVLSVAQPVETGDNIEVREMFWYGCPHCFKLEPMLNDWLANMPEGAEFVRMPAIFSPVWEQHAKYYYTLEAMGQVDELHEKVFDAIHIDNNKMLEDDDFIEFAADNGLDPAIVEQTLESFAVQSKLNATKTNIAKYQVTGVPAFVVGGKYLTDVSSAGSEQNMFAVIDFLINKAQSEQ